MLFKRYDDEYDNRPTIDPLANKYDNLSLKEACDVWTQDMQNVLNDLEIRLMVKEHRYYINNNEHMSYINESGYITEGVGDAITRSFRKTKETLGHLFNRMNRWLLKLRTHHTTRGEKMAVDLLFKNPQLPKLWKMYHKTKGTDWEYSKDPLELCKIISKYTSKDFTSKDTTKIIKSLNDDFKESERYAKPKSVDEIHNWIKGKLSQDLVKTIFKVGEQVENELHEKALKNIDDKTMLADIKLRTKAMMTYVRYSVRALERVNMFYDNAINEIDSTIEDQMAEEAERREYYRTNTAKNHIDIIDRNKR